jgi:hypothetical protein
MLRGSAHTRAGLRTNQTHGGVLHRGDGNSNPDAHFCAARCSRSNKASTEQTAHLDRHPEFRTSHREVSVAGAGHRIFFLQIGSGSLPPVVPCFGDGITVGDRVVANSGCQAKPQ